ncbi:MAG TPA: 1-(5-phosphoribosyl)-5-[(5-phosphoribosylamino)methylideneamino]imidazole-4-carboxamide isomerase [Chloroflexota bacterium]|nr:1-(5-phosphoribosyl)-5-[(5-phosphoribosylamino)methylideneamino]imidazole-4-carboxamide isomerase [Chloroflexota bacterium]
MVRSFEVIPAIDILDGRCVRLAQGDFARASVFRERPEDAAVEWEASGATTIHVVDLDGAKAGEPANLQTLAAIRQATRATIQFGGGLRNDDAIAAALEAGADRVVVGTALVTDPEWVARLCQRHGERIVAGIDARDGRVAAAGWLATSALTVAQAVERAHSIGIRWALFTDIARDGMLEGPNLESLKGVVAQAPFDVIASGGVTSIDDLLAIRDTGAAAAIVGRALYAGRIDLRAAILACDATTAEVRSC